MVRDRQRAQREQQQPPPQQQHEDEQLPSNKSKWFEGIEPGPFHDATAPVGAVAELPRRCYDEDKERVRLREEDMRPSRRGSRHGGGSSSSLVLVRHRFQSLWYIADDRNCPQCRVGDQVVVDTPNGRHIGSVERVQSSNGYCPEKLDWIECKQACLPHANVERIGRVRGFASHLAQTWYHQFTVPLEERLLYVLQRQRTNGSHGLAFLHCEAAFDQRTVIVLFRRYREQARWGELKDLLVSLLRERGITSFIRFCDVSLCPHWKPLAPLMTDGEGRGRSTSTSSSYASYFDPEEEVIDSDDDVGVDRGRGRGRGRGREDSRFPRSTSHSRKEKEKEKEREREGRGSKRRRSSKRESSQRYSGESVVDRHHHQRRHRSTNPNNNNRDDDHYSSAELGTVPVAAVVVPPVGGELTGESDEGLVERSTAPGVTAAMEQPTTTLNTSGASNEDGRKRRGTLLSVAGRCWERAQRYQQGDTRVPSTVIEEQGQQISVLLEESRYVEQFLKQCQSYPPPYPSSAGVPEPEMQQQSEVRSPRGEHAVQQQQQQQQLAISSTTGSRAVEERESSDSDPNILLLETILRTTRRCAERANRHQQRGGGGGGGPAGARGGGFSAAILSEAKYVEDTCQSLFSLAN